MPNPLPDGVTLTPQGKRKYSHAFKLRIIERIKKGETATALAQETGAHATHIRSWVRGRDLKTEIPETGFVMGPKGTRVYSTAFKQEVVRRMQAGETAMALAREFKISNSMLYQWQKNALRGTPNTHPTKKKELMSKKRSHKKMPAKKPSITDRFKEAAIERFEAGELAKDIAKDLKINVSNIYNWTSKAAKRRRQLVAAGRKGGLARHHNVEETAPVLSIRMRDAVALLKHAESAMYGDLQEGKIKRFEEQHLLVLQALRTLTGG
jgi:transposase-like protein